MLFFCLFKYFKEKEYQTESKRNETFGSVIFWNEHDPEDLECKSRSNRGGQEIGGRAHPSWARPCLLGPTSGHRRTSSSYIYLRTSKTSNEPTKKPNSTAVTFCIREIPSWSLHRRSTGGGIDHEGLLHQHHSPFDEL